MGATAETRISKRRISGLEDKLKKFQRELQKLKTELKLEKRKVGSLRKQTHRALQTEADCADVLDLVTVSDEIQENIEDVPVHRCRNAECIAASGCYGQTGACDVIAAGVRLIVVCRDCGCRYTVDNVSPKAALRLPVP